MKITKVTVHLLRKELASAMWISRGGFQTRYHAIVEVETDAGITGLGEGIGSAIAVQAAIQGYLADRVTGLDPSNIGLIRQRLLGSEVYFERKGSIVCGASAIEMACWDIKGKALGVPVYELLGGKLVDVLPAYASDIYWEKDPAAMAKNAARIISLGYKTVKVHIGVEPPRQELMRLEAVRKAIGDQVGLMIDLNAGYNQLTAMEATDVWRKLDVTWLEEPVPANQSDAQAKICKLGRMPVASGENEFCLDGFKELFAKGAVDIAMPDIGRVGGIQEARDICVLARAFGIPVSPHNFSSGILLAATVHLMAATEGTLLLECDSSGNAVYEDLLSWSFELVDGSVKVPDCTGLGVTLPPEIVTRYRVE